ncbi:hypothetical protein CCY99_08365 [Helicobacter sp. 16-1353]|uniref:hemerythrin domain-containing protein n=1 Tax=Helicobacter sp. 16-1353 TaxID=2004996 RepID=UPI000DCE44BC|nr:hemerythrin domain-containing protein [Helicobacter sp. 16-1353]RAX51804.1 hypothetical protein CCY99_08365 [Helicobacter sp. 16-1353]
MQIREYMINEHRECDEILSQLEDAVISGDWGNVGAKFNEFRDECERHFLEEEQVMFVEFEAKIGIADGPTKVMTMEHNMVRETLKEMQTALESSNKDRMLGLIESVMLILQQHNMKEEQMLYNMVQMHLSDKNDEIINRMKEIKV